MQKAEGLLALQKDTMFFPVFSPHPNLSIFCSIRDDMLARIFTCTHTRTRAHVPCWSWWKNIKIWEILLLQGTTKCFQGSTRLPITHLSREIVRALLTGHPGHQNHSCTDREEERSGVRVIIWRTGGVQLLRGKGQGRTGISTLMGGWAPFYSSCSPESQGRGKAVGSAGGS